MFFVRMRNQYRALKKVGAQSDINLQTNRLSAILREAERAFQQHLRLLIGIARSGGAKVVLSSFATLHDPAKNYSKPTIVDDLSAMQQNAAIRAVAEEEKTGWADNANEIPHQDEYFLDRAHFSRKGAARMAENLLPVALEQLQSIARGTTPGSAKTSAG